MLVCLSACTPPHPAEVKLVDSSFNPYYEVKGLVAEGSILTIDEKWRLMTEINRQLPQQHRNYLFIRMTYPIKKGRFINASDDKAQDLPVTRIHKSPLRCRGCNITEDLAIDMDENYLVAHANTGIKIRMVSDQGYNHYITVTPAMVQQQIAFIQKEMQKLIISPPPAHSS